ncbi:molybdenum cofactor guanylyltransferase [Fibrobacterota bacterium]
MNPKTIVIAGARSRIGKTTLALRIHDLLEGSEVIKLGHGRIKPEMPNHFYEYGTSFETIKQKHLGTKWLIIESNSIRKEINPDVTIFLDGEGSKPSAQFAREHADIISGTLIKPAIAEALARRLEISGNLVHEIIWLSGARPEPASAVILAGGNSRRMGTDKANLMMGDKTVLEGLVEALHQVFDQVILSGSNVPQLRNDIMIVPDEVPGKGPLMGICSALKASSHTTNFIIACDIPNIDVFTLRLLLSRSSLYEIVLPSVKQGYYEPLFAVYQKQVWTKAEKLLDKGIGKISELINECRAEIVTIGNRDWYVNLNTPEDFEKYLLKTGAGNHERY